MKKAARHKRTDNKQRVNCSVNECMVEWKDGWWTHEKMNNYFNTWRIAFIKSVLRVKRRLDSQLATSRDPGSSVNPGLVWLFWFNRPSRRTQMQKSVFRRRRSFRVTYIHRLPAHLVFLLLKTSQFLSVQVSYAKTHTDIIGPKIEIVAKLAPVTVGPVSQRVTLRGKTQWRSLQRGEVLHLPCIQRRFQVRTVMLARSLSNASRIAKEALKIIKNNEAVAEAIKTIWMLHLRRHQNCCLREWNGSPGCC